MPGARGSGAVAPSRCMATLLRLLLALSVVVGGWCHNQSINVVAGGATAYHYACISRGPQVACRTGLAACLESGARGTACPRPGHVVGSASTRPWQHRHWDGGGGNGGERGQGKQGWTRRGCLRRHTPAGNSVIVNPRGFVLAVADHDDGCSTTNDGAPAATEAIAEEGNGRAETEEIRPEHRTFVYGSSGRVWPSALADVGGGVTTRIPIFVVINARLGCVWSRRGCWRSDFTCCRTSRGNAHIATSKRVRRRGLDGDADGVRNESTAGINVCSYAYRDRRRGSLEEDGDGGGDGEQDCAGGGRMHGKEYGMGKGCPGTYCYMHARPHRTSTSFAI